MLRVAQQYFSFQPDERVHVTIEDGRAYVRRMLRGNKRYQLIMLDAYERQYIPEHMLTQEFLTEVRSLLLPAASWRPIPSPPAACIRTSPSLIAPYSVRSTTSRATTA